MFRPLIDDTASGSSLEHPFTSIVVVAHNGVNIIKECLNSIKKPQSLRLEVIVVDNASVDDTTEEVSKVYPAARIIRLPANKGYGGGCNAGARVARGDILLFVNQDVSLSPTFLDKIASMMVKDNRIGVCGSVVLSWDGSWLVSTGQIFDRWTGYGLDYGFGSLNVNLRRQSDNIFSPNGAAFAVRREVFNRIGGFNEYMFMYFEETDLAWRARIAGYRVACCQDAIVHHKISLRRAHSAWSRYYIDRNSLLSAVENYEFTSLLFFLPSAVMFRIAGFIILTLFRRKAHARSMLRALNDFFALLPKSWRRRRSVHCVRKLRDREVMRKEVLASPLYVLKVFYSSLLPSTTESGATLH